MTSEHARAFNEGCDARIRGEPCTRPRKTEQTVANYFVAGWHHVNNNWGIESKIPVKPLPPVRT